MLSYAIIDGKQRLETIWAFMKDEFALAKDFEYYDDPKLKPGGLRYSEMAMQFPQLKTIFDSFVIPIVCVETDYGDLIQEMFSRLNEAVPLNAAEKRNAFGGPMKTVINQVAKNRFFTFNVPFSNKRYQHREVSARLLFLEYSMRKGTIVDTKKEFLDEFVKEYKKCEEPKSDDRKPEALRKAVTHTLTSMSQVFVKDDPLLQARASVVIYYLLFRSAWKESKPQSITRKKIWNFDKAVQENRDTAEKRRDTTHVDFDLLQYSRLSIQGTNDASSIRERLRIIAKYLKIQPHYEEVPTQQAVVAQRRRN